MASETTVWEIRTGSGVAEALEAELDINDGAGGGGLGSSAYKSVDERGDIELIWRHADRRRRRRSPLLVGVVANKSKWRESKVNRATCVHEAG